MKTNEKDYFSHLVGNEGLCKTQTHCTFRDSKMCKWNAGTGAEDVEIGKCLMNVGVAAGDSRDEVDRTRFFPFPPGSILIPGTSLN